MATGCYLGGHADAIDGARPASEAHLEPPLLFEVAVAPTDLVFVTYWENFSEG